MAMTKDDCDNVKIMTQSSGMDQMEFDRGDGGSTPISLVMGVQRLYSQQSHTKSVDEKKIDKDLRESDQAFDHILHLSHQKPPMNCEDLVVSGPIDEYRKEL